MYRPRVVPVLLLRGAGLYKSQRFSNFRYIGDPLNTVRIFESFQVDEVVILDTLASRSKRAICRDKVRLLSGELSVPLTAGGGLSSLRDIELTLRSGAERVVLGSAALRSMAFVGEAVREFGGSSISICVDVIKNCDGGYSVFDHVKTRVHSRVLEEYLRELEQYNISEVIVQSVDLDGMMTGYDHKLMTQVLQNTNSPIMALGGANAQHDILAMARRIKLNSYGLSSAFIFASKRKGVLIKYPSLEFKLKLREIFNEAAL